MKNKIGALLVSLFIVLVMATSLSPATAQEIENGISLRVDGILYIAVHGENPAEAKDVDIQLDTMESLERVNFFYGDEKLGTIKVRPAANDSVPNTESKEKISVQLGK